MLQKPAETAKKSADLDQQRFYCPSKTVFIARRRELKGSENFVGTQIYIFSSQFASKV